MRQRAVPVPSQRAITLARPSSTSCQVTSRPIACHAARMCSAIFASSPVGLGMLMTSQHIATISSSLTSARILSTSFGLRREVGLLLGLDTVVSSRFSVTFCQPEVVRVAAQFFVTFVGNQKIILEPQAAAAGPINSWLDGQYHSLLDRAFSRLMRVRELMRSRSDA